MTVTHDGSLAVSERITAQFEGEFHGISRDIPIEYPGPHGTNFTLFLKITGVTDENGNKLRYESHTSNGYRHLKIYVK